MLTYNRATIILFLLLSYILTFSVSSQTITVAFPQNIPPWVMQSQDRGISIDIVSQAMKTQGINIVPYYIPFARMTSILEQEGINAVAMVEGNKIAARYYSDTTSYFYTSLISLAKHNFHLTELSNLYNKRIMAFQDASKVFVDLAELAKNSTHYQEIANQENQVALLFKGRVDFILIDKSIFHYWRNKISKVDTSKKVIFHDVSLIGSIPIKSPTHVVFKSKRTRDAFNKGLQSLIQNGQYQRIIDGYIKRAFNNGNDSQNGNS